MFYKLIFAACLLACTAEAFAVEVPMTYNGGALVGDNKKIIAEAVEKAGATERVFAMILAMAMFETEHLDTDERDKSQDHNPMMKSYGAFNFNGDFLQMLGLDPWEWEALNDVDGLARSTELIIRAYDNLGWDKFFRFYRGNRQVKIDVMDAKEGPYQQVCEEVAFYFMWNREFLYDCTRVPIRVTEPE